MRLWQVWDCRKKLLLLPTAFPRQSLLSAKQGLTAETKQRPMQMRSLHLQGLSLLTNLILDKCQMPLYSQKQEHLED